MKKMRLFDDYVYTNLKKYGNCSIGYHNLVKYGEDAILKDLKENGFVCSIKTCKDENRDVVAYMTTTQIAPRTYAIATVIREEL